MPSLPLAVGIADTILRAVSGQEALCIRLKADELVAMHPDAKWPAAVVADILRQEAQAAGANLSR